MGELAAEILVRVFSGTGQGHAHGVSGQDERFHGTPADIIALLSVYSVVGDLEVEQWGLFMLVLLGGTVVARLAQREFHLGRVQVLLFSQKVIVQQHHFVLRVDSVQLLGKLLVFEKELLVLTVAADVLLNKFFVFAYLGLEMPGREFVGLTVLFEVFGDAILGLGLLFCL